MELVVVALIAGILLAVTAGGVGRQIQARRADIAKARMAVVWQAEKRYYAFKTRYIEVSTQQDWDQLATPDPGREDKYYNYRVDYDGTDFTVRAVRREDRGDPALAELKMDKRGNVTPR